PWFTDQQAATTDRQQAIYTPFSGAYTPPVRSQHGQSRACGTTAWLFPKYQLAFEFGISDWPP
ncbi:MAG: hypothetical protein MK161_09670, partial [Pirellulales bacterium]|nr:hypothetical protein [Pirellulales bacterium]